MSGIVGDDPRRVSGQCELQHQIVLWIWQVRSPQEMNPAFDTNGNEIVQKVFNCLFSKVRNELRAVQNILIFEAKWGRNDRLKSRRTEFLD